MNPRARRDRADRRHGHPPRRRRARRVQGLLAAVCLVSAGLASVGTQPRDLSTLRFGFSASLVEDANLQDAASAMVYWVKAVGIAAGGWQNAEAHVIENPANIAASLGAHQLDLFALSTTEYLSVERSLAADPCMAFEAHGEIEVEYVLLARAGAKSLEELRGKRLTYFNASGRPGIGDAWLDVALLEAGLPERDRTFAQARPAKKASQAILPVFFNQSDAALVTRSSFDTAVELNPQLGKGLTVLARSPRLLPGLVCARRSLSADLRRRYVEKATTIHESPEFKQTFMVLRMNRLVPWDATYLNAARRLLDRYQALKRKATAPGR